MSAFLTEDGLGNLNVFQGLRIANGPPITGGGDITALTDAVTQLQVEVAILQAEVGVSSSTITQPGHGFAVGQAVRVGAPWQLAWATSNGSAAATHLVVAVVDADTFVVAAGGIFPLPGHGLGAAGAPLYLASAPPGAYAATLPPQPAQVQQVARVIDANRLEATTSPPAQVRTGVTHLPEYSDTVAAADPGGRLALALVANSPHYVWQAPAGQLCRLSRSQQLGAAETLEGVTLAGALAGAGSAALLVYANGTLVASAATAAPGPFTLAASASSAAGALCRVEIQLVTSGGSASAGRLTVTTIA